MRRSLGITCALIFFLAGTAAAWAECNRISLDFKGHHHTSGSAHAHDHHHSDDPDSHTATIHCPTLDEFVPSALFLLRDHAQSFNGVIGSILFLASQQDFASSDSNAHGPPFLIFSPVPLRLQFSVLRI